jgi:hypothetical protein
VSPPNFCWEAYQITLFLSFLLSHTSLIFFPLFSYFSFLPSQTFFISFLPSFLPRFLHSLILFRFFLLPTFPLFSLLPSSNPSFIAFLSSFPHFHYFRFFPPFLYFFPFLIPSFVISFLSLFLPIPPPVIPFSYFVLISALFILYVIPYFVQFPSILSSYCALANTRWRQLHRPSIVHVLQCKSVILTD